MPCLLICKIGINKCLFGHKYEFLTFRGRPVKGLILILACSWGQLACSLMSVC